MDIEYNSKLFFHKEEDSFHVGIFKYEDGGLFVNQLNTDHESWGGDLNTWKELEVRFKSFTGENIEFLSESTQEFYKEKEK